MMPYAVLAECESRSSEPVTLEADAQTVTVRWDARGTPCERQFPAPSDVLDFPEPPGTWADNESDLLSSLADAAQTTDAAGSRYALECIRLRGDSGRIDATDSRQLLVQSGFRFPWSDDVLIPATAVFAAPELHTDGPVRVGRTDGWIAFRFGDWTIYLAIQEDCRFPDVDHHIASPKYAQTSLAVTDSDAAFLVQTLKRLPGITDRDRAITIDLNGSVACRVESGEDARTTEIILSNSHRSGEPNRFATAPAYLTRAMTLGFRDVHVFHPESPVVCQSENRTYVWASLGNVDVSKSGPQPIRIVSPAEKRRGHSSAERNNNGMSARNRNGKTTKDTASENGASDNGSTDQSPIERAEAMKNTLQDAVSQTRDLIATLRQQQKQNRMVRSTLQSLKQLQGIDV